MAVGLHAANLANGWLNLLRNVAFTAKTNVFVKLHTGDPGSAGTANASSVMSRPEVTFAAASGGSMASSNTPSWSNWAGVNGEVVSHISVWDSATTGNFLFSVALASSKTVNTGDTLNLTSLTVALTPIAA
ncbi:hypothetical protein [Nonomuraea sp. NPDC050202]|uniref:phage tail fiber protein n=1 Tax=Nonomuraea sp. NPDC050202 TaxID=3155035 RepID=UPI0033E54F13